MKFTSKDSTEKLIKYAAETLGLDLSGKERPEVIAEMKKADASLFPVDKPKDQAVAPATANNTTNTDSSNDQDEQDGDDDLDGDDDDLDLDATTKGKELIAVTINIPDDSGDDETEVDNFVQVGVNGVMHQVQKGVDVKVNASVYEVLNNAIESRFKTVTDPNTKLKSLKETQVKRWPFSVIQKHYA